MEVSAPVKIIEGHSDVLGITTEVLPGAGECAIITSSSAVNVLSVEKKSVTSTWTFPNNQRESLVCPAYFSSKGEFRLCSIVLLIEIMYVVKVETHSFNGKTKLKVLSLLKPRKYKLIRCIIY